VAAMRFNIMNIEFLDHVGREFEQIHSRKRGVSVAIVRA